MNRTAYAASGHPLERWMHYQRLRAAERVGVGARIQGPADIGGGGKIRIGDRFLLSCRPVRSHMFASPRALITIGDDVTIGYGAAIAAQQAITIGNHTVFGPFVVIMDNDFHRVGDRNAAGEVAPVLIGSNVSVGARVTILRGTVIDDDVSIMSGSMVSGAVPRGVTIGGVPARIVVGNATGKEAIGMTVLVQTVLGLAQPPLLGDGPDQIPAWDSLGTLRLLLAIEETYRVSIREEEMRIAPTVAALAEIVAAKLSSMVAADDGRGTNYIK